MIRVQIIGGALGARAELERAIASRRGLRLLGGAGSQGSVRKSDRRSDRRRSAERVGAAHREADVVVLFHDSAPPELMRSGAPVVWVVEDPGSLRSMGGSRPASAGPTPRGDRGLLEDPVFSPAAILPRAASTEQILAAIEAVAAGLFVTDPDMLPALVPLTVADVPSTVAGAPDDVGEEVADEVVERGADEVDVSLTPRESEILSMLAEGWSNRTIAGRLGISAHTVKYHVESILEKLQAETRTEAVAIGLRTGRILL